jgi:hypothetical protein
MKRKLREANTRGSVGSYHNERFQATDLDPLRKQMNGILTQEGISHESESNCDCGGIVRYDEHLGLVCDDCSTFYGYRIVTDNFMNMGGEEESSGDDDSWKAEDVDCYDDIPQKAK